MSQRFSKKEYIRASEVGQYAFCRRAWWLKRVGGFSAQVGSRFEEGDKAHLRHGQRLRRSRTTRRIAYLCFSVAVILLVVALLFLNH